MLRVSLQMQFKSNNSIIIDAVISLLAGQIFTMSMRNRASLSFSYEPHDKAAFSDFALRSTKPRFKGTPSHTIS